MTDLGFTIEQRAGTDVLVYDDGSCHPATPDEVTLAAEVERLRANECTRQHLRVDDVDRAERAEAERDRLQAEVEELRRRHG